MAKITTDQFIEVLERADIAYRSDYGGRGMMDARCIGIDVSPYGQGETSFAIVAQIMVAAVEIDYQDNEHDGEPVMIDMCARLMRETREDSMGLGSIIYWPRLVVE